MAEFIYHGIDKTGKKVTGRMDVPNEGELRMVLRAQGIRPLKVAKSGVANADIGNFLKGGSAVTTASIVLFCRQLHVLISSGIPLVQALDVLGEQSTDPILKKILIAVKERVSQGAFFWEALASYPRSFPKIFISLIKAGEASGSLDVMLRRLTNYLEDLERIKKNLKSAMMYPVTVGALAAGVVTMMLTFVVPKFEDILRSSGQELPGVTRFVINISHGFVNNFTTIFVVAGFVIFMLLRYARSPEGSGVVSRLTLYMPIFGKIILKAGVARFARTLSTLLSSGVNLVDAVEICRTTAGNIVIEEAVGKIRAELENGKSFAGTVARLPVFPKMVSQMIAVGESTGNLDKMLDRIAEFYEEEVETQVAGLSKMIEPIVLVVLGGLVGGLMIAMYLPIFKLAGGGV